jgi:hypothetical protein
LIAPLLLLLLACWTVVVAQPSQPHERLLQSQTANHVGSLRTGIVEVEHQHQQQHRQLVDLWNILFLGAFCWRLS